MKWEMMQTFEGRKACDVCDLLLLIMLGLWLMFAGWGAYILRGLVRVS